MKHLQPYLLITIDFLEKISEMKLSQSEMLTYLYIAFHCDKDGKTPNPIEYPEVVEDLRLSQGHVYKSVKRLKAKGLMIELEGREHRFILPELRKTNKELFSLVDIIPKKK